MPFEFDGSRTTDGRLVMKWVEPPPDPERKDVPCFLCNGVEKWFLAMTAYDMAFCCDCLRYAGRRYRGESFSDTAEIAAMTALVSALSNETRNARIR